MSTPTKLIRTPLVLLSLVGIALVASGCGTSSPNPERGRVLFVQKCGGCHTLAEAGTVSPAGPDLDDAFAAARSSGQSSETIEGVVRAQVDNPRPGTGNPAVSMPADLVTGRDLEDVAAYVGRWAGVEGAAPPESEGGPGAQVFTSNGCGGCHVLSAAGGGGVAGPDLDKTVPQMSKAELEEAIVDPNAEIAAGYQPNVMPPNFDALLSPTELKQLIEYLTEATSGGGK